MVTQFGMSDALGNVDLASNTDRLSSETKRLIESEVRRTIEEGRERATQLLKSKRKELDLLAKALIDYETLNKDEAFKVVKGEKLEGKVIMPKGSIKIPENIGSAGLVGSGPNGMPGIPEAGDGGKNNPTPPEAPGGGVMA
jgi:ATP-dependent metalloprotease